MSPVDVLLIIAGVAWILGRRLMGQLIEVKGLLVVPIVLTAIGLSNLSGTWTASAAGFAVVSVLLSVGIGVVRGRTVHLGNRDGQLWMRYRASSIGLWVLNFAVKGALFPLEHAASAGSADRALMLSIGLGVLAETAVVLLRAMQRDGEIVWTKGKDGAPHTTNPTFERIRQGVNAARDGSRPMAADSKRFSMPARDW